jgi:hypothetical protein
MLPSATVIKHVLAECRDDYVGLWSIVRRVANDIEDRSKVMETTLELLGKLLREDDIAAGTFEERTSDYSNPLFCTWDQPVDKILRTIETEWQNLGRDPDIGEIVWFTSRKELKV